MRRKALSVVVLLCASLLSAVVFLMMAYGLWLFTAPLPDVPSHLTVETISPLAPVKQQDHTQLCWAYAMLAAIETEHFRQGDSLNLPIEPVVEVMKTTPDAPPSQRAMGQTLLNLIKRYGIYGAQCDPTDYIPLCTTGSKSYGQWVIPELPDNWEHNRFLNLHPDTLLDKTIQAVCDHRGVCWEGDVSERGFSFHRGVAATLLPPVLLRCKAALCPPTDDHCMAIVGIVHDDDGTRYFVMKNSWGTSNPHGGLMLMTFDYFRWNTVAVYLPREVLDNDKVKDLII